MRRPMSANFDDPKSPAFVACRSDLASYKLLAEPMLPVVEESLTQLAAGPATINLALASLEQLWLGRIRIHAPSVGVTVLHPSVFAFILTAATDECRINGELAQASRVYMPGAQHGFYIRGGRRESIGARSDVLEQITHNARGAIIDVYTAWEWPALCEAVSCLEVDPERLPGRIYDISYDICVSQNANPRQSLRLFGGGGGNRTVVRSPCFARFSSDCAGRSRWGDPARPQ